MRQLVSVVLLTVALGFGVVGQALGGNDTGANRLLVEAVKLVDRAEVTEHPGVRAELYERALLSLDEIVAEHPASDVAVKLSTGQAIGEVDRRAIERQWRLTRAEQCIAEWDRLCLLNLAFEMSEAIEDDYDRSVTLSVISEGQARAGAFIEARRTADAITHEFTRVAALTTIAEAMVTRNAVQKPRGILDQAASVANSIGAPRWASLARALVARALYLSGDEKGALTALRRATELTREVDDPSDLSIVSAHIGWARIEFGDIAGGRKVLVAAREYTEVIRDPVDRIEVLGSIARIQAETGDSAGARNTIETALSVLESVETNLERDEALYLIVYAQATTGDIESALELAKSIDEPFWRAGALAECAAAQFKHDDVNGARRSVDLAFRDTKSIQDAGNVADTLAIIGLGM